MNPFFFLQLFAEGAAAPAAEAAPAQSASQETASRGSDQAAPAQSRAEANQEPHSDGTSDAQAEFEALIRGKYAHQFQQYLQNQRYLQARDAHVQQQYALWQRQAEDARADYPELDMNVEAKNPQFRRLLHAGLDVGSAYLLVHRQEILERSAREVEKRIAGRMMSAATRPSENGSSGQASAVTRSDVASMSRAERDAIRKRAARGEKIRF